MNILSISTGADHISEAFLNIEELRTCKDLQS